MYLSLHSALSPVMRTPFVTYHITLVFITLSSGAVCLHEFYFQAGRDHQPSEIETNKHKLVTHSQRPRASSAQPVDLSRVGQLQPSHQNHNNSSSQFRGGLMYGIQRNIKLNKIVCKILEKIKIFLINIDERRV